jgi:hypothetical protein
MEVSDQLHAPAALPPGKEPQVPMGQDVLDAVVKRKILSFCRDSNHRSSSPLPSAIPTELFPFLLQKLKD